MLFILSGWMAVRSVKEKQWPGPSSLTLSKSFGLHACHASSDNYRHHAASKHVAALIDRYNGKLLGPCPWYPWWQLPVSWWWYCSCEQAASLKSFSNRCKPHLPHLPHSTHSSMMDFFLSLFLTLQFQQFSYLIVIGRLHTLFLPGKLN